MENKIADKYSQISFIIQLTMQTIGCKTTIYVNSVSRKCLL